MNKGFSKIFNVSNEPTIDYKGKELASLMKAYKDYSDGFEEVPLHIGSQEIKTKDTENIVPPHDHKKIVGNFHKGTKKHVEKAIKEALKAKKDWENMSWENRSSIFIKAANLLKHNYRYKMNASTMVCQSKNIYQAEIDAVCELIDFLNFNISFAENIYKEQPISTNDIWNRLDYRPLEGFVYAISPFNFTSIAANLAICPAMLGNVVIWKPSEKQMLSANLTMQILKEAGLPAGVINMLSGDPKDISDTVLSHNKFAGLHFTGSTFVFQEIWKQIGNRIGEYDNYPRIVGETGGKGFIWAHNSANRDKLIAAILRGAFEYQGQKCSAASRIYIPRSIYKDTIKHLVEGINSMSMGSPEDSKNFINAVIDSNAFDRITKVIDNIKDDKESKIICGGAYSKKDGYFIQPTLVETINPNSYLMKQEFFGPIATIYVYEDKDLDNSLELVNNCSYSLTGAVFAEDRYILDKSIKILQNSAGNLYINDKPTGAVVGNQPFGGSRLSGTNDKAGSPLNLTRWLSPRTIKENFNSPISYKY